MGTRLQPSGCPRPRPPSSVQVPDWVPLGPKPRLPSDLPFQPLLQWGPPLSLLEPQTHIQMPQVAPPPKQLGLRSPCFVSTSPAARKPVRCRVTTGLPTPSGCRVKHSTAGVTKTRSSPLPLTSWDHFLWVGPALDPLSRFRKPLGTDRTEAAWTPHDPHLRLQPPGFSLAPSSSRPPRGPTTPGFSGTKAET